MNEIVERVARAIEASLLGDLEGGWHGAARAAIKAMREPTDEMLLSGFLADELDNLAGGEGHEPTLASYRAMIDEALKVPA